MLPGKPNEWWMVCSSLRTRDVLHRLNWEPWRVSGKMRLGFRVGLGNVLFPIPVEPSKHLVKYLLTAAYGVKTAGPWSLFLISIQSRVLRYVELWIRGSHFFPLCIQTQGRWYSREGRGIYCNVDCTASRMMLLAGHVGSSNAYQMQICKVRLLTIYWHFYCFFMSMTNTCGNRRCSWRCVQYSANFVWLFFFSFSMYLLPVSSLCKRDPVARNLCTYLELLWNV